MEIYKYCIGQGLASQIWPLWHLILQGAEEIRPAPHLFRKDSNLGQAASETTLNLGNRNTTCDSESNVDRRRIKTVTFSAKHARERRETGTTFFALVQ